jgi:hypothetical protein
METDDMETNHAHITALVDEGLRLNVEIATRELRLKAIDAELKALALARPKEHVKLKDPDREGTRFLAHGTSVILPIVCTADAIRQSFGETDPALPGIRDLGGESFAEFYRRTVTWEAVHVKSNKFDGKAFRAAARQLLPDPERFIKACLRVDKHGEPVSQVRVNWDDLERHEP